MADVDRQMLGIFLNDHLALATAAAELAKRVHRSNPDGALGDLLARLDVELDDERAALLDVMRRLDVRRDRLKELAGWVGEKGGRMKLNGRLVSYSPMSRVNELEGLTLLVTAQRALWRGLRSALGDDERLAAIDLPARVTAAQKRLTALDRHRDIAVRAAVLR
jgi:hypothetical protein